MFGLIAVVLYVIIGQWLTLRTFAHFRERDHTFWPLDLTRPDVYTERGNELRRQALMFLGVGGGVVLALLLFGLWFR